MTVRSRQRDMRVFITGTYWNLNTGTTHGAAAIGIREWCEDVTGHFDQDNPFAKKHWETITPRISGRLVDERTGILLKEFVDYPIDWQPDPDNSRVAFVEFDEVERFKLARELLAKTIPTAPRMGSPESVGELKDLWPLVKDFGELIPSIKKSGLALLHAAALGYISWRWVVKPMARDICTLCRFADDVARRLRMVHNLRMGKAVRRNVKLRENSATSDRDINVQSNGAGLVFTRRTTCTEEVWGSARWRALVPEVEIPGDLTSQLKLARNLTFGLTDYQLLATAWELMPWSWFADWFAQVGDWITHTNNTIQLDCESICLMRKTTSSSFYVRKVVPEWISITDTFFEHETYKARYPITPWLVQVAPPLFSMPALTSRQWSILGALAVLRINPVDLVASSANKGFLRDERVRRILTAREARELRGWKTYWNMGLGLVGPRS